MTVTVSRSIPPPPVAAALFRQGSGATPPVWPS